MAQNVAYRSYSTPLLMDLVKVCLENGEQFLKNQPSMFIFIDRQYTAFFQKSQGYYSVHLWVQCELVQT